MVLGAQIFQLNLSELRALDRFYKRAPKQFGRASAIVLNEFAFNTRSEAFDYMVQRMVIRDTRFLKSRIQVRKARAFDPVRVQESEIGSIETQRFTGWIEQETGKEADKTRTASLLARGGKGGKIKSTARLKPNNDFPEPKDYPGKNAHHKAIVMMQILSRAKGRKKPFKVYGHRTMKPGLYKFGRGRRGRQRIDLLQRFEDRDARTVHRVKWLTEGRRRMFSRINLQAVWGKALRRVLKLK
jgi:hypothetical protein